VRKRATRLHLRSNVRKVWSYRAYLHKNLRARIGPHCISCAVHLSSMSSCYQSWVSRSGTNHRRVEIYRKPCTSFMITIISKEDVRQLANSPTHELRSLSKAPAQFFIYRSAKDRNWVENWRVYIKEAIVILTLSFICSLRLSLRLFPLMLLISLYFWFFTFLRVFSLYFSVSICFAPLFFCTSVLFYFQFFAFILLFPLYLFSFKSLFPSLSSYSY
jgi:hypothetical protein